MRCDNKGTCEECFGYDFGVQQSGVARGCEELRVRLKLRVQLVHASVAWVIADSDERTTSAHTNTHSNTHTVARTHARTN